MLEARDLLETRHGHCNAEGANWLRAAETDAVSVLGTGLSQISFKAVRAQACHEKCVCVCVGCHFERKAKW